MANINPIIRVEHVRKIYNSGKGKTVEVFKDLNLETYRGEFLAVVGPTGCGKTTLLNLIAGFDKPQSGSIYVDGVKINSLPDDELAKFRSRKFGVVFQSNNLIPSLTVFENVELPLALNGVGKSTRRRKVEEILDAFWLKSYADRRVSTLSVGERRIVCLARAMALDPEIILMDEPTDFLDPFTVDLIIASLKGKMMEGKTIIATTHHGRLSREANRTIRLKKKLP